jgi:hypothetical protein
LEYLLISPCLKRRFGERAIRDYLRGEHQNSPYPFNIAPTSVHSKIALQDNDYELTAHVRFLLLYDVLRDGLSPSTPKIPLEIY